MRKRKEKRILENIEVSGYAAEGKALARLEGKVLFIQGAVPGDKVDVWVRKSKKDWAEGKVVNIIEPSPQRVEPFCRHFGTCGGCKWQMMPYQMQLQFKQQEVEQNMRRIGHLDNFEVLPILGSEKTRAYRNKLEFTASNKRFLTSEEILNPDATNASDALGYHAPGIFDKVIDIYTCHLLDEVNDRIRNTVRDHARANNLVFYDIRNHTGFLRNIVLRFTTTGELMVNVVVNEDDPSLIMPMLQHLITQVPEITTLLYTVNTKWNDTIYDLEPVIYKGNGYVTEKLGEFSFIISPKSFFQTNTKQAENLYNVTLDFAGLTGNETVYDLYCGTGSIGIFLSKKAGKIIGVELIEQAIEDARKNAALNGLDKTEFFAGDVIKICDDAFFEKHGRPDVIVTDPPRAGMHEKLVNKLMEIAAPKIVYVSCNSATQARDIALLSEKYNLIKIRPVDMFPHTHHIENVALLTLKADNN